MNGASGPTPEIGTATAVGGTPGDQPWRRRPASYLVTAVVVAGVSLLLLLSAAVIHPFLSSLAANFGSPFGFVRYVTVGGVVVAGLGGLAAAVVLAILGAVSRGSAVGDGTYAAGPTTASSRTGTQAAVIRSRRPLLVIAAGIAAVSVLLLFVFSALSLGYGLTGALVMDLITLAAVAGLAVAGALFVRALLPGRVASMRTRAFIVIAVAVFIPSVCLAALGVYAYYASWERATWIHADQAQYQAGKLAREIASVQRQRGRFTADQRARLAAAIAAAYGRHGHLEGAQLATLAQVRATRTLPAWAIRRLEREGYAIGSERGPGAGAGAEIVAWRVGPQTVRYFVPQWTDTGSFDPPIPGRELWTLGLLGVALIVALGLLGAWILSRSVVRPVRRLAEASGRLAEGEAGVTVKPSGPRELRELAVSFNDMNAKMAKAQETEQAFLLSVSHELKTPLTSIRGYAEGIGDGTVEPAEGAAVIGTESGRLERLVGDLLESGRMRKSAFSVRREAVDLAAVAEDVGRRYEATARDAGLALLLATEAGGGAIADHERVLQVVSNLAENAIRCTPAPGTVTITTAPGAITVADTGRGLTSDDLPRAFERFYLYSRYGTDRPVGTGLGLAIVKELTEAMGGSVRVSSAVGLGTAFTVSLPPGEPVRSAEAGPALTAATEPLVFAPPTDRVALRAEPGEAARSDLPENTAALEPNEAGSSDDTAALESNEAAPPDDVT